MTGDIICCLSVLGEPIIGRGSGRRAAALCRILKRRKNSFENTKTGKTREKYKIKIANSLIINVIGNLFWVPGRNPFYNTELLRIVVNCRCIKSIQRAKK